MKLASRLLASLLVCACFEAMAQSRIALTHDANGNVIQVDLPNNVVSAYDFDPANRLFRITHKRSDSGAMLAEFAYVISPASQRERAEESDAEGLFRTVDYVYDGLKRLTTEHVIHRDPAKSRTTHFAYDKVGNRETKTETSARGRFVTNYSYNDNDELLTESSGDQVVAYAYDANGNTKRREVRRGGSLVEVTKYEYDFQDRLTDVFRGPSDEAAALLVHFAYDAKGNLIGTQRADGSLSGYLVDVQPRYDQIIEETHVRGVETSKVVYIYATELVSQARDGRKSFYLKDALGSVRLITDGTGAVTDRFTYSAFGELEDRTGSTPNTRQFTSEHFDSDAGLYFLRARWMNPAIGRFVTRDKFWGNPLDPASLHAYTYAKNDPVGNIDPSGYVGITSLGLSPSAILQNMGARVAVRQTFKKFGCELAVNLAEQSVNYGIYILIDSVSGGLYVGSSDDINRRFKEHVRQAAKDVANAWKANARIIARIPVAGGPQALLRVEQLFIDILEKEGLKLMNDRNAVGRGNKQGEWEKYNRFRKLICPKS